VALGDGMLNVASGNISSNQQSQISGPIYFGGPAVGTPLQLTPNEVGLSTSPTSETSAAPGTSGLKLRVECDASGGTAKLVVLAGTSPIETTLADNIGGSVSCKP
jgi:hypothetical protein